MFTMISEKTEASTFKVKYVWIPRMTFETKKRSNMKASDVFMVIISRKINCTGQVAHIGETTAEQGGLPVAL